jgi:hypothetical protein
MSGTDMHAKPVNIPKENYFPHHSLHNPNDPLPGALSGQQQCEVRYSDKNLSREVVGAEDACDRAGMLSILSVP